MYSWYTGKKTAKERYFKFSRVKHSAAVLYELIHTTAFIKRQNCCSRCVVCPPSSVIST